MEKSSESLGKTIYDSAKSHFLGNFPSTLPIEQAYVHIGMYLGWIVENNLYSDLFFDESETQIYRFLRKEINYTILSELWDGYLGPELFSKEGNLFTYYYYGGGLYKRDYEQFLTKDLPSLYHVKDTWDNFDTISGVISARHSSWKDILK